MDLGLEGRRVLIVGASYGIGLAAAKLIAAEGADLVIASRSADNLAQAKAEISGEPRTIVADITDKDGPEALAGEVAAHWDGMDTLISAVGGSVRSAFENLSDEDWLENYRFNILSGVKTVRAMLPLLRRGRQASIILLGAAAAKMPYPHQIVSNVHKAGQIGLVKTLSAELAPEGIRINIVAPGRTLTPLWIKRADGLAAERGTTRDAVIAEFAKDIPLGRFARPEEVAVMVTWMASPLASYVTGQAINVDGGIARGLL